jgi:hypothetical protein
MFGLFNSTVLLAFESSNVIGLRMMKIISGGSGSHDETNLMVTEKVQAMLEAGASLLAGATASSVVDRYREHVAANAKRLSPLSFTRPHNGLKSEIAPSRFGAGASAPY